MDPELPLPEITKRIGDATAHQLFGTMPAGAGMEKAGDFIGSYKLIEPLGEGGFGTVWRAEQHEPIHREVALKVIKAGMDSREIIARFEAERQALALMDHPNIAGVLDAGTTQNGRPYFVMELVKGKPITDYADAHKLTIRERLELFIPVCQAVQHAHQKAILHRDLKPSNILVTEVDGKAVPKVIDFGIAKALGTSPEAALNASLLQTQIGAVIGTPRYMSPEQAGASADMDTRSDIYTLGVILYELLTGDTPLSEESLRNAVFDEVLRMVRESSPKRPSSRVVPVTELIQQTAATRGVEPGRLTRTLRGDLDWITLKALEKERERRYGSAAALAADIGRHLKNEPVEAGPPSAFYRFRKLVRRNRLAFTASAIVLLSLVGGISSSVWQWHKAEQALGDLKKTAPTFHSVAKSLVDQGKFEEAIEKIGYAIQLDDGNADYHLFRANLLEATQDLTGAIGEYRQVLTLRPSDDAAKSNLELCIRLLAENGSDSELRKDIKRKLLESLKKQERLVEAAPLSAFFEPDIAIAEAALRARLQAYRKQAGWKDQRIARLPDGTFKVDLGFLAVGDLSVLRGLPVSVLNLHQNLFDKDGISDLSALTGLPLKELEISDSKVTDLSPLRGMPLEKLDITRTPVADLSPLEGMKLRRFDVSTIEQGGSRVTNLKPLAGMPLEYVDVAGADGLVDISPLRGAPLKFLRINRTRVSDLSPLKGAPLENLDVSGTEVGDLSPLSACFTLKVLNLYSARRITDLSPLSRLKLVRLSCHYTGVKSIEPLRGHPLKYCNLAGWGITDLSPLLDCPTLEEIMIPNKVGNIEILREMPNLRIIQDSGPPRSAEQFWKEYDQKSQGRIRLRRKLAEFTSQPGWNEDRLSVISSVVERRVHGMFSLDLRSLNAHDLALLRGEPIASLRLDSNDFTDLSPLEGAAITELDISNTGVTDLRPLANCPNLDTLEVANTQIQDLSPLAKLRLRQFKGQNTPITDISPLSGSSQSLQLLWLNGTGVRDFSPVLASPTLREITIPRGFTHFEVFRPVTSLKSIAFGPVANPVRISVTDLMKDIEMQSEAAKRHGKPLDLPPATTPLSTAWADALTLVDPVRHAEKSSTWKRLPDGIEWRFNQQSPTYGGTFQLPVELPPSYDLECEYTSIVPSQSIALIIPVGDERNTACWFFREHAGIAKVDGMDPHEAGEPGKSSPFTLSLLENRRHTARAEVRRANSEVDIRFSVDGKIVGSYRGDRGRLTLSTHWRTGGDLTHARLGANGLVIFHRASVRALADLNPGEKASPLIALRDPKATAQQIDLSAFYNLGLGEDARSGTNQDQTFEEIPHGLQTMAGTLFDVRGMVQLKHKDLRSDLPDAVRNIRVAQACDELHFLHSLLRSPAKSFGPVASYLVTYEDGTTAYIPVQGNRNVGHIYRSDGKPAPAPMVTAWMGQTAYTRGQTEKNKKPLAVLLYKMTWRNPHPEKVVKSLDFVSADPDAAPVLFAVTAESGSRSKRDELDENESAPIRTEIEKVKKEYRPESWPATGAQLKLYTFYLDRDRFDLAESVSREVLRIREKIAPESPATWKTRSELGEVLALLGRFAEAEPLLLSAFEGIEKRRAQIKPGDHGYFVPVIRRIVALYAATKQTEKVAEWKLKLAAAEEADRAAPPPLEKK